MIEDIAITEVVPHRDGEYGLFLLESRAWEIKLEPGQAETIREGLATATGGEYNITLDTKDARRV